MIETLIFIAGLLLGAFLSVVMIFGVGTGRRKRDGATKTVTKGANETLGYVVDARTGERYPMDRDPRR